MTAEGNKETNAFKITLYLPDGHPISKKSATEPSYINGLLAWTDVNGSLWKTNLPFLVESVVADAQPREVKYEVLSVQKRR